MSENKNTLMKTENLDVYVVEKRKLYTKPHLEEIGDLRTMTLGPSLGPFESSGGDMSHHEPPIPGG